MLENVLSQGKGHTAQLWVARKVCHFISKPLRPGQPCYISILLYLNRNCFLGSLVQALREFRPSCILCFPDNPTWHKKSTITRINICSKYFLFLVLLFLNSSSFSLFFFFFFYSLNNNVTSN